MQKDNFILFFLAFVYLIFSFDIAQGYDVRSVLEQKMKYLSKRQAVVSKNIANANTPGYKAKEVKPMSIGKRFNSSRKGIVLKTTSVKHINPRKNFRFKVIESKDTYETAPDENNVVLEEQISKMNNIDLEYQNTVAILHKFDNFLKAALGE